MTKISLRSQLKPLNVALAPQLWEKDIIAEKSAIFWPKFPLQNLPLVERSHIYGFFQLSWVLSEYTSHTPGSCLELDPLSPGRSLRVCSIPISYSIQSERILFKILTVSLRGPPTGTVFQTIFSVKDILRKYLSYHILQKSKP